MRKSWTPQGSNPLEVGAKGFRIELGKWKLELRIEAWKSPYLRCAYHGSRCIHQISNTGWPFLLQLMLGAALQASNSEYQLCLVRDTQFQTSAPDDVFWVTLTISNISFWDQLHPIRVKFGETSTNPYSKYFKMFKIIQLKYIMTIFKFVESKIKIRFCAPWFLHVWAISWEFSSRFGRSQNDSWLTGPVDFIWWKFNGKFLDHVGHMT